MQLRNIHFQLNVPCFHGNVNGGGDDDGDRDSGCGRDADDVDERY